MNEPDNSIRTGPWHPAPSEPPVSDPVAVEMPQLIGRYSVRRLLGEGGFEETVNASAITWLGVRAMVAGCSRQYGSIRGVVLLTSRVELLCSCHLDRWLPPDQGATRVAGRTPLRSNVPAE
jgi:hypothetical protein